MDRPRQGFDIALSQLSGGSIMAGDICDQSAADLGRRLAAAQLTSVEITQACLRRVSAINGQVNAICTLNPEALAEAAASDERRRTGVALGPLDGVPFVAKDNLDTRGLRTTFGSELMADYVPAEDCVAVERLRRAGAVLLGKANTPEFAHDIRTDNLLFGPTRNPVDLKRTAGGSSGGTAAAVAAGLVPIGLGTDLGGSIRIPAAMCGIVGLRPSPGRVPVYPTEFGWDLMVEHVHGPIARSVEDLGLMLAAMAGPDERDPSSLPTPATDYAAAGRIGNGVAGRRIAYCHDFDGLLPIDREVGEICRAAARGMAALGCAVEDACFDASDLMKIVAGTRGLGMVGRYAHRVEAARGKMTPHLLSQIDDAMKIDLRVVTEAERLRTRYWHRVRQMFERFDYIVTPAIGLPAFLLDEPVPTEVAGRTVAKYDVYRFTYAFSVVGLPVVAVPCGFTREGLPVGLQIAARRLHDESALEIAAAFVAANPEFVVRPSALLPAAPQ